MYFHIKMLSSSRDAAGKVLDSMPSLEAFSHWHQSVLSTHHISCLQKGRFLVFFCCFLLLYT